MSNCTCNLKAFASKVKGVFLNKLPLVLIAGLFLLSMSNAKAQCGANLVNNGNFEQGNTGFTTDYTYFSNGIIKEGEYEVIEIPHHPCFSGPDHTFGIPGVGKAMYVNGSKTAGKTVWQQTITGLSTGTTYNFAAWISRQCGLPDALLQFSINGVAYPPVHPSNGLYNWTQVSFMWSSGSNTTAVLRIEDLNTVLPSNDFGLDDISFIKMFPATGPTETVTSTPVSCPNGSNGSITITAAGGSGGYSYSINNGVNYTSGANPFTFSNLSAGSYMVRVKDLCGRESTSQSIVLTSGTSTNSGYVIYAKSEVSFGDNNHISGDVGVTSLNGKADFEERDTLDPYFIRAQNIEVDLPSAVNNRDYHPATGGPTPTAFSFSGTTNGLADLTISSSPAAPVSGNYKKLQIKKNVTVTLTGTLYGEVDIEEGCTVTFSPPGGILNIEDLEIEGSKLSATTIKFSTCTSIRIKKKVDIKTNVQFNTINSQKVVFYLANTPEDKDGEFDVEGVNNNIVANTVMNYGELEVKGGDDGLNTMNGLFIADEVESGENVNWINNVCVVNCPNIFAPQVLVAGKNPQDLFSSISTAGANQSASQALQLSKSSDADVLNKLTVSVSPNPSRYNFHVTVSSNSLGDIRIRLLDMSGRIIETVPVMKSGGTIILGDKLIPGMYLLEVKQGNDSKKVKLIKLD